MEPGAGGPNDGRAASDLLGPAWETVPTDTQAPQLKRGLFGYKPQGVRSPLADRDEMLMRAQEQLASGEEKVS